MKKIITVILILLILAQTNLLTKASSYIHFDHNQIAENFKETYHGFKKRVIEKYHEIRCKFDDFHLGKEIMNIIYDVDVKAVLSKLRDLENSYYERLLQSYKIDINAYKQEMKAHHYDENYRKQYIMQKTKISEAEYNQKFVSPFQQISKPAITENMTLSDIKKIYKKYLEDKINYLEKMFD